MIASPLRLSLAGLISLACKEGNPGMRVSVYCYTYSIHMYIQEDGLDLCLANVMW